MTVNTITAPAVRSRACPLCEAPAGRPCQDKPSGDHLARYLDAYTAGQLTRQYMAMVLAELVVVDGCTVIEAAPATRLERLLAAGCRVIYVPDTVWDGCWFADLRDAHGRMIETGSGATQAEALAGLARRLDGAR